MVTIVSVLAFACLQKGYGEKNRNNSSKLYASVGLETRQTHIDEESCF